MWLLFLSKNAHCDVLPANAWSDELFFKDAHGGLTVECWRSVIVVKGAKTGSMGFVCMFLCRCGTQILMCSFFLGFSSWVRSEHLSTLERNK